MTTTSPAPSPAPAEGPPRTPRRGSLLRAEVHRFTARRFIRVLVLLGAAAFVVISTLVAFLEYSKASEPQLAEARQEAQRFADEQNRFRDECLRNIPESENPAEQCPPEQRAEDFDVAQFVDKPPFVLADNLPDGAAAMGVAAAVMAFVLGATYVGAEWSSKSMVALLFWETRRLKVMAVKIGVTAGFALALGIGVQLMWFATAQIMARTRGTVEGLPEDFWPDLLAQQVRSTVFVVIASLVGFGIANLVRNTGAALGVGFVYFAIVESAVRGFLPSWQQWLLTDNAAALVNKGGHQIFLEGGGSVDEQGMFQGGHEIVLSNLRGGVYLGLVTAALVGVGVLLFKRRDLT
ncbi:MAG: ABC transporter permease subunit [Actinomycetes bacterium]